MAYLRFVVQERNRESGFRYGILRGAEVIRQRGALSVHEDQRLSGHDLVVETIFTERPGFIVYDDEFQVVAEPFSETPT